MSEERLTYTVEEKVARLLDVGRSTAYAAARSGELSRSSSVDGCSSRATS